MTRAIAVLLALVAWPAAVRADRDSPPPRRGSLLGNAGFKGYTGARIGLNPLTGGILVGARYRHIYRLSDRLVLDGAAIQAGADIAYAIATARSAVHFEWQPLAVTRLRAQYETWLWTGITSDLGHGLSFPSADAPFGPDELRRREGEEEQALGHRLLLVSSLEGKLGPVVGFTAPEIALWYIHGEESYWLEPQYDNLIQRGSLDATVRVTSAILLEVWSAGDGDGAARIGALHEVVHTLAASLTRHRLGGLLTFTPRRSFARLHRPTVSFSAGSNLEDPNRQGEPWLLAGLAANF